MSENYENVVIEADFVAIREILKNQSVDELLTKTGKGEHVLYLPVGTEVASQLPEDAKLIEGSETTIVTKSYMAGTKKWCSCCCTSGGVNICVYYPC